MSIRNWPTLERPREKLLRYGSDKLSDAELLAIFLRSGTKGKSAIEMAREALSEAGSLRSLLHFSEQRLCQINGIGQVKFVQFQAALELGKRYLQEHIEKQGIMTDPQACRDFLTMKLRDKPYEVFYVVFLDSKHQVIHHQTLFRGTIDGASVPIREVVTEALKYNSAAMVVAHNHPSGVAEPSRSDKVLTERLSAALAMFGIKLLDHFVVGEQEVISFAELGYM